MHEIVNAILTKIKQENPVILNLTNTVTMNFIANGLLSVGASPIMCKEPQELADLLQITRALVINIGTLTDTFMTVCQAACELANARRVPIILDPVGAGASAYRTKACKLLLERYSIAIVRANASEIMALAEISNTTKGVDSTVDAMIAMPHALTLAKTVTSVICISGKSDVIIHKDAINQFRRGSAYMPLITGTGCLLSAVVAAFHAVQEDAFIAASAASLFYSICGEIAANYATGPGSFYHHFLDALHCIPDKAAYDKP